MELDDHEEQEEETGIQVPENSDTAVAGNTRRPKMGGGAEAAGLRRVGVGGVGFRYRECQKNHALSIGGHAVDGCGEFMPAGEDGTLDALKCAACNCHRNFHRKETKGEAFHHHHHRQQQQQLPPYYRSADQVGYLQVAPQMYQRPLALPSAEREEEDMSNPSSSGGGGSGSKKRFRTKFTRDQKDKMLEFSERLGWRIQKQDEAAVEQFCADTGIKRHVLKVWMHNNKHTLVKKP